MKKLSYLLKSVRWIYEVYFYVMSALLRFAGVFWKVDQKLILFNSFGGKKYDDSPRAIYEEMKQDPRFKDYKLVWALQEPEKVDHPKDLQIVRGDTVAFFKTALKAKCWITNSSMERGLQFKKGETVYFNTWHGTAIKKMGVDIADENKSFRGHGGSEVNIMLAQGQYDVDVFSRAFEIPKEKFRCIGLPRNDVLANYTEADKRLLRKKLKIPEDKKVILYAPTFREYEKGSDRQVVLTIPINLQKWSEALGSEYVALFRAHYEVAEHMNVKDYPMFMDVSAYPTLSDLMIVSDLLITDYSSICFDYSIMDKPIFCFAYDLEKYQQERGMYFTLEHVMPGGVIKTENDLLEQIKCMNYSNCITKTKSFREKFVTEFGQAAKRSCDEIWKELND